MADMALMMGLYSEIMDAQEASPISSHNATGAFQAIHTAVIQSADLFHQLDAHLQDAAAIAAHLQQGEELALR
jgi:hypothetical protein